MADADAALHRFVTAAVARDVPTLLAVLLPEALLAVRNLGLEGAGPLRDYTIVERQEADVEASHTVRFEADETFFLRLRWRRLGDAWKLAGAERAADPTAEAAPAPTLPVDLSWLGARTEWGVRAPLTPLGLPLANLAVGRYGDVPEVSDHATQRPRGAEPRPGVPAMGYTVRQQAEVWSPDASKLYEEAIQRRWRPATDLPWEALTPLPDDIEAAWCQLCTALSERAVVAADAPAAWESRISYDFLEVKLWLATQTFDAARHAEAFRKRALANGGGLGVQSPGEAARAVLEAQSFSELSLLLHVLLSSETLWWLQIGALAAPGPLEAALCGRAMQDVGRWLAFGVSRLRFLLERQPERADELHTYLTKAEGLLAYDDQRDGALNDALVLLLSGPERDPIAGAARRRRLRQRMIERYLGRLAAAGLPERRERLSHRFAASAETPA